MTDWISIGEPYKDYLISGDAQAANFGYSVRHQSWYLTHQVLLIMPNNTCLEWSAIPKLKFAVTMKN